MHNQDLQQLRRPHPSHRSKPGVEVAQSGTQQNTPLVLRLSNVTGFWRETDQLPDVLAGLDVDGAILKGDIDQLPGGAQVTRGLFLRVCRALQSPQRPAIVCRARTQTSQTVLLMIAAPTRSRQQQWPSPKPQELAHRRGRMLCDGSKQQSATRGSCAVMSHTAHPVMRHQQEQLLMAVPQCM